MKRYSEVGTEGAALRRCLDQGGRSRSWEGAPEDTDRGPRAVETVAVR